MSDPHDPLSLNWRPMTEADLDGVVEVARLSFPNHPEERACFANRLALHPQGCFVLGDGAGGVFGYMVAYPWTRGSAPALNALIPALPGDADLVASAEPAGPVEPAEPVEPVESTGDHDAVDAVEPPAKKKKKVLVQPDADA